MRTEGAPCVGHKAIFLYIMSVNGSKGITQRKKASLPCASLETLWMKDSQNPTTRIQVDVMAGSKEIRVGLEKTDI